MINYEDQAKKFVHNCFILLGQYRRHPEYYEDELTIYSGSMIKPYAISINKKGQLALVKQNDNDDFRVISHSYNGKYSQFKYIGIMLGHFLEELQKDFEE